MSTIERTTFRLNPFFRVRFSRPPTCDLFLSGHSYELPDTRYLSLLARLGSAPFARGTATEAAAQVLKISAANAERVVDDLMQHELVVPQDRVFPELDGVRMWVDHDWTDALMLHLQSRDMLFEEKEVESREAFLNASMSETIATHGVPEIWKEFPTDQPAIELPVPAGPALDRPLEEVLLQRRSNGGFKRGTATLLELSTILGVANRRTKALREATETQYRERPAVFLDSAFSALETYVVAFAVDGVAPGLYHYDVRRHRLVLVREGVLSDEIAKMAIGQWAAGGGAFSLLVTGIWSRYMFRYPHPRAYRNLMINVSELAHKYLLLATAHDFGLFLTPNFEHLVADQILGVDGYDEAALYLVGVG